MAKKISTVAELIESKKAFDEREKKSADVYVPAIDGDLECRKLGLKKVLAMMNKYDATDTEQSFDFQKELIYSACPLLQDKALHDFYGIVDPFDVVEKVLSDDFASYKALTDAIMGLNGLGDTQNELKN